MKYSAILFIGIICLLTFSASAQNSDTAPPVCFEPTAQTFDEFVLSGSQDLKTRAKQFEDKLRELPESQGVVFLYGGKKSKTGELSEMAAAVTRAFTLSSNGYASKIWIREGGYRAEPTVVFKLRPLKCTEQPLPSSDLTVDQIEFSDYPPSNTVKMATSDLLASIVYEPTAVCPPAVNAVRACTDGTESEVFIIAASSGEVVFAKSVGGHPLVRTAAEAIARKWYFKPYKEKEKAMNRSGTIVVRFTGVESHVDY